MKDFVVGLNCIVSSVMSSLTDIITHFNHMVLIWLSKVINVNAKILYNLTSLPIHFVGINCSHEEGNLYRLKLVVGVIPNISHIF